MILPGPFKDTGGSRDTHETDTRTSQTNLKTNPPPARGARAPDHTRTPGRTRRHTPLTTPLAPDHAGSQGTVKRHREGPGHTRVNVCLCVISDTRTLTGRTSALGLTELKVSGVPEEYWYR